MCSYIHRFARVPVLVKRSVAWFRDNLASANLDLSAEEIAAIETFQANALA